MSLSAEYQAGVGAKARAAIEVANAEPGSRRRQPTGRAGVNRRGVDHDEVARRTGEDPGLPSNHRLHVRRGWERQQNDRSGGTNLDTG